MYEEHTAASAGLTLYAEAIPGGVAGLLRGAGFAGTITGVALLSARSGPGHPDDPERAGAGGRSSQETDSRVSESVDLASR